MIEQGRTDWERVNLGKRRMKMRKISMKATMLHREGEKFEVKVTRSAELRAGDLAFQNLGELIKDIEKINVMLKSAIAKNLWIEFEIVNSALKGGISYYDRWYYCGYPANDNGGEDDNGAICYYLRPDTKYTPEHHDMMYDYTLKSITDGLALSRRTGI